MPSPWILLAEFQVAGKLGQISLVCAHDIVDLEIYEILDAREPWEWQHGALPGAHPISKKMLKEILSWPTQTPILVYCHFGVRSLDVAVMLVENGFSDVSVLEGGIDAWAEIDSSVKRYEHAWC